MPKYYVCSGNAYAIGEALNPASAAIGFAIKLYPMVEAKQVQFGQGIYVDERGFRRGGAVALPNEFAMFRFATDEIIRRSRLTK